MLDEFGTIKAGAFLGFRSFLGSSFKNVPSLKLLDPVPIQFIPVRLLPGRKELGYFCICKFRGFSTMLQSAVYCNLQNFVSTISNIHMPKRSSDLGDSLCKSLDVA